MNFTSGNITPRSGILVTKVMDKRSNALIVVSDDIERSQQKLFDKNNGLMSRARFRSSFYISTSDGTNRVSYRRGNRTYIPTKTSMHKILNACISHTVITSNHHCPSPPSKRLVRQSHPPVTHDQLAPPTQ